MFWLKFLLAVVLTLASVLVVASLLSMLAEIVYKFFKGKRMEDSLSFKTFGICVALCFIPGFLVLNSFYNLYRYEDECHAAGYNIHKGKCYQLIEVEL